ncbi:met_A_Alw26, type II restriction m6 adenine DNA methyltransferase, Alw26I/Eco31I/Esp3I family [Candidatus Nanopelagicaceae bacterium]
MGKFLNYLLELPYAKEEILYSLGRNLLGGNDNPAVEKFLSEYKFDEVALIEVPGNEFDLLGSAYQYLNSKMENLEKGSFYTGKIIALDFVNDLDFESGQIILDPACGSGSFLFRSNATPEQIYGVDADPIAVMIAKFNYFIKFPEANYPNLHCQDFFTWFAENEDLRFDYIIGNPPYGANLDLAKIPSQYIFSGESFSYFIEFCFWLLKDDGIFRFLLPEAILNVKRHSDVRSFILKYTNLKRIKRYSSKFAGVMSDVYMLELNKVTSPKMIFEDEEVTSIPKSIFRGLKNQIFVNLNKFDIRILEKVEEIQKYDLSESVFGLGVVTGDNKTKLTQVKESGMEHIYTGKEVEKYRLLPPKNFIRFDRDNLQQVAPDEIYRAPEKLIYKTISKYLKISIDKSRSLTTNSANIFIPKVPEMDIYEVLGLLNSELYSYLHLKLFGGVNKIARENLMALPFPSLSLVNHEKLRALVNDAIENEVDGPLQDFIHFEIFNLTIEEIAHIKKSLN